MDFVNVIATFDPDAPVKVVLAAHHDSKWFEGREVSQLRGAEWRLWQGLR